ncbi:hypothetical protein DMENIID0001_044540 [Sergentomyia squamirostris]
MPEESSSTGQTQHNIIATSTSSSNSSGSELLDSGGVCEKNGVIVELPLSQDGAPLDESLIPDQSSQLTDSLEVNKPSDIYEEASEGKS